MIESLNLTNFKNFKDATREDADSTKKS